MFFAAMTKDEIAQILIRRILKNLKEITHIITNVIDNFLSKRIIEKDGFSIIESPLITSPDYGKIIFTNLGMIILKIFFMCLNPQSQGRSIYYYLNEKGEFFCSTYHISMLRKAGVPIRENIDVIPEFFYISYRGCLPKRYCY